ncbi:TRAP transporter small permease [Rhodobacteraceae bacterium NNCM2]|nr:TRAP transporter small permease [Coraliihabitans acroporae]
MTNVPLPEKPPRNDGARPHAAFNRAGTRLLDRVATLCMGAAGIMLVIIIAIFGWLVYGRYILNDTPTWVEQVSLLLVVWITFLGTAVGVQRNNHLSVDFIREALPSRARWVMRILSDLLVLAVGITMVWQGWNLVVAGMGRAAPMLGISEAWRALAIPTCGVLITIFMIWRIRRNLLTGHRMSRAK